jgi:hypothetical protein
MPPVQPAASVAATGLGIRYLGDYAYAYSGEVLVNSGISPVKMLEFDTGSGIVKGWLTFSVDFTNLSAANKWGWKVSFNGEVIMNYLTEFQTVMTAIQQMPWPILIPPQTNVKVEAQSGDDPHDVDFNVGLVARVYGAV